MSIIFIESCKRKEKLISLIKTKQNITCIHSLFFSACNLCTYFNPRACVYVSALFYQTCSNWNHRWQHLKVKIPLKASQDTKATPTLNWKYRWQPHKVQRPRPLSPMKDIKQGAWTQICRQLADQNLKNWKSVVKGAHGHGQLIDQDGK